jgi:hypothetical protein
MAHESAKRGPSGCEKAHAQVRASRALARLSSARRVELVCHCTRPSPLASAYPFGRASSLNSFPVFSYRLWCAMPVQAPSARGDEARREREGNERCNNERSNSRDVPDAQVRLAYVASPPCARALAVSQSRMRVRPRGTRHRYSNLLSLGVCSVARCCVCPPRAPRRLLVCTYTAPCALAVVVECDPARNSLSASAFAPTNETLNHTLHPYSRQYARTTHC